METGNSPQRLLCLQSITIELWFCLARTETNLRQTFAASREIPADAMQRLPPLKIRRNLGLGAAPESLHMLRPWKSGCEIRDPMLWMSHLAARPFRLQETLFDPAVPDSVSKKMREALPENGQFASYPDQDSYR